MTTIKPPLTWVDEQLVSAATLNTEIRDRFRWLLGHSANPKPHARVRSTVPIPLAPRQWTALRFDTTEVDRGGMWLGAGSALVAPLTGRYRIGAAVATDRVASNKGFRLIINASRVVAQRKRTGTGRVVPMEVTLRTTIDLEAGDFIEAEAWHDYPQEINATPDTWCPVLTARWQAM